jgi:pimeloyl-ACP methyl ester carboxylesterase
VSRPRLGPALVLAAAMLAGCGGAGPAATTPASPAGASRTAASSTTPSPSATSPAASPTITAMANQASALISALGLGRTAVLGWSIGGMIAQALAVLHPAQVSRLVLAATQPGTGAALPIPAAAAAAAASANPAAVLSVLFPPDQAAAAQAYVAGILRYPGFYQAPRPAVATQEQAIRQWLAGRIRPGGGSPASSAN